MFLDEIWQGDESFSEMFGQNDDTLVHDDLKGEWGERRFTLKFLQGGDDKKELGRLVFIWWPESSAHEANLQNFDELSGDLANFSWDVWISARKPKNKYDVMDIEFGDSPNCRVPVNDLILPAHKRVAPKDRVYEEYCEEVAYIDEVKGEARMSRHNFEPRMSARHGGDLVQAMMQLLGCNCTTIVHESDLRKLGIVSKEQISPLELYALPKKGQGRGQSEWYVHVPKR